MIHSDLKVFFSSAALLSFNLISVIENYIKYNPWECLH